jgi:hypothetical protein
MGDLVKLPSKHLTLSAKSQRRKRHRNRRSNLLFVRL